MAFRDDGSEEAALVVSFGEMPVDFVPDVAGVSLAESTGFLKAPGGAPANVAVAIAKLGGKSAFVGNFGDDEFGHMIVDILKKNGVDDEGVLFDPHTRTALAFVTLMSNGEREFMFYRNPSADMLLTEAELNLALIHRAKISTMALSVLSLNPVGQPTLPLCVLPKKPGFSAPMIPM